MTPSWLKVIENALQSPLNALQHPSISIQNIIQFIKLKDTLLCRSSTREILRTEYMEMCMADILSWYLNKTNKKLLWEGVYDGHVNEYPEDEDVYNNNMEVCVWCDLNWTEPN